MNDYASLFDFDLDTLANRKGVKWESCSAGIIPMWIADTDYGVAPEIKDSIIQTVKEEHFHYHADSELLDLMATKVNVVNHIPVDQEGTFILQGVIPAMWLACNYACNRDEEVIVTNPMYYPFFTAAQTAGVKLVSWPLMEEEAYQFDIEKLKNAITPKTKLIFICNPHNPTGRVMTKKELSAISDLAIDHDLIVMSDELWEDILYDNRKHVSIASLSPEISNRTLTVFGFSKAYNIAGLQIGYAVSSNTEMITDMKKKTRGIFRETTTISQAVAKTILSGKVDYYLKEELRYLHRVRDYSINRLKEMPGVICNTLEGTYLLFPNITSFSKTSTEMVRFLRQDARVEVSNGSRFGTNGDGHIRLNIGTSLNILRTAFNRIEKSLDKLR